MKKRYSSNRTTALFSIIFYLVNNVSSIKFYFQKCLTRKTPLELELPWIAYDAIKYLDTFLSPDHEVFEYGGGGSTIYFAKKVKLVKTLENNIVWKELIQKKIHERKISNINLTYINYDHGDNKSFYNSSFSKGSNGKKWSAILIDNIEIENFLARRECFYEAEKSIEKGGVIVLDDFWRYPELKEQNKATKVIEFVSICPGRRGLTNTAIFHY